MITGRDAPEPVDVADTVAEMREAKRADDTGAEAITGVGYQ